MTDILLRSDVAVTLDRHMGDDQTIADTARVTHPDLCGSRLERRDLGLLNMLMRDRHGTPFESVVFRFHIEAPIVVAREAHRHRMASVNEESGRYRRLRPEFYLPAPDRPLVQTGKPGAYTVTAGTDAMGDLTRKTLTAAYQAAWDAYEALLAEGVAREVARFALPVSVYTSWYLTLNLRALFNFLSLRRVTEATTVPTFPMREIEMMAERMEWAARTVVPEAMSLFDQYGRVSP